MKLTMQVKDGPTFCESRKGFFRIVWGAKHKFWYIDMTVPDWPGRWRKQRPVPQPPFKHLTIDAYGVAWSTNGWAVPPEGYDLRLSRYEEVPRFYLDPL